MILMKTAFRFARAASVFALMGFSTLAHAAEITPEHLAAARLAIDAIQATDQFDLILPQAAESLRGEMIQKDPNLEAVISSAVDEEVLKLAARRADLETEAARAYANIFSPEELKGISEFYKSEVGKKLIAEGNVATRKVIEAANIWQTGIARDLAEAVGKKVKRPRMQRLPLMRPLRRQRLLIRQPRLRSRRRSKLDRPFNRSRP